MSALALICSDIFFKKVERSYSEIHWSKKCDSRLTYKYIKGVLKCSCLQLFSVMVNLNKHNKISPQQWFFQTEANVSSQLVISP